MATASLSGDGGPRLVAETALSLLVNELVPAFHPSNRGAGSAAAAAAPDPLSAPAPGSASTNAATDANDAKEAAFLKLEALGYRVGYALAETLTRDKARLAGPEEAVKFVCKEFWTTVFSKQADNLKTNHKGVYVWSDHHFRWFRSFASVQGAADTSNKTAPYLAYPCGLVRGALANLGVAGTVAAEAVHVPHVTFQMKVVPPPPSLPLATSRPS